MRRRIIGNSFRMGNTLDSCCAVMERSICDDQTSHYKYESLCNWFLNSLVPTYLENVVERSHDEGLPWTEMT